MTWVEPMRAVAEVVPMPARFGPLVATMVEAVAPSPFGVGSASVGSDPAAPPAVGTISVTATPALESAALPGNWPGAPSPAPEWRDLPPLLEPTGRNGVVQSYLVAAAGSAALDAAFPALASAGAGVPAAGRAMIRVHDGHSGRSVVMVSREGVGDGRLVITVVFN